MFYETLSSMRNLMKQGKPTGLQVLPDGAEELVGFLEVDPVAALRDVGHLRLREHLLDRVHVVLTVEKILLLNYCCYCI